jgi:ribosomal protein S18 acetylase RimI-like enzyme
MEIRPYAESDEPAVVALWREVFPGEGGHNEPTRAIRDKLAYQRELFFVATLEGAVVGTVMAGYDGHRGWIYRMAVSPRHQRQGIGAALIRHAEKELADRGCPKINLQVLASNAGVVAFYKKLGYHVEERVSMGKRLGDPTPPKNSRTAEVGA